MFSKPAQYLKTFLRTLLTNCCYLRDVTLIIVWYGLIRLLIERHIRLPDKDRVIKWSSLHAHIKFVSYSMQYIQGWLFAM